MSIFTGIRGNYLNYLFTTSRKIRKCLICTIFLPPPPPPLEISGHISRGVFLSFKKSSFFFKASPSPAPLLVAGLLKKELFFVLSIIQVIIMRRRVAIRIRPPIKTGSDRQEKNTDPILCAHGNHLIKEPCTWL